MTPKSMKKRLILTPRIGKKRPAFRLVFQRFWGGKPEAQYQERASIPSFFLFCLFGVSGTVPKNRRHSPTLEKTLCRTRFLAYAMLWRSPCHRAAAEGAKLSKFAAPRRGSRA